MGLSKTLNIAMRGLQFLWTLLLMALIGNMIAEAWAGDPSIVNYAIFVATFSMLSLFYLIPATLYDGIGPGIIMIALDVINNLLWFCGAVALAAYLGVHSCDNKSYINHNLVTDGTNPGNRSKRCREAQASCAFLWFGWAAFMASTVLSFAQIKGSGVSRVGGIRRGGPSMRQV